MSQTRGGLFGSGFNLPTLTPVPLQPAPIPGSTFVRPQQVQAGGNAQALADALSGLNRSLSGFAATIENEDKDPNSRANKDYLNALAGKDAAGLQAMAAGGEFSNEIQEDGLSTLLGSKSASDFRLQFAEFYETEFDKNGGNLPVELEQRRQEVAAGLPNDAARAAFFKATDEWSQRLVGQDLERRVEVAKTARNDGVVSEFRIIGEEAAAGGATPQEIASQIVRQSGLNRSFRGLSGAEQNATLFALAQEYALQGKTELVRAILEDPRDGVGSVAGSAAYAVKSAQLIEAAQGVADKEGLASSTDVLVTIDREAAAGTLTPQRMAQIVEQNPWMKDKAEWQSAQIARSDSARKAAQDQARAEAEAREMRQEAARSEQQARVAAAESLTRMMGASSIEDVQVLTPTGGTRTYSRQDQINDAVGAYLTQFKEREAEAIAGGMSPEDAAEATLRDKVNFFSGNALSNPEWERTFNATAIVSSATRLAAGGEIPQSLASVAETYRKIAKLNPAFAASLIKDDRAGEFLEAYAEARDDVTMGAGANPQDALMEAARLTSRTKLERAASSVSARDAEEIVRGALVSGWFSGPNLDADFRDSPQNIEVAGKLVQRYMGRGMSRDLAARRAAEVMSKQAVFVNGVAIMGTGRNFPKDFAQVAEGALDAYAKAQDPDASGEDLFLIDIGDGTGRWAIMRKDGVFTGGTLADAEMDAWRKAERDRGAQEAATWGKEVRDNGWTTAILKWGLNGFEVGGGDMTVEEAERFLADDRQRQVVDAFVKKQATKDGIYSDGGDGWMRAGTRWSRATRVRPVVTWSAGEKSVRWEPVTE